MVAEIQLTISKNGQQIQVISKSIQDNNLLKSLTDFQLLANTTLTNMIADSGDAGGDFNMEDEDDSESEEDHEELSPKKKKK